MAGETAFHPASCERARQWCSLGLDGELSEVERGLLDRHLAVCPACRRFDADVSATTAALRASESEAPVRTWAERGRTDQPRVARRPKLAVLLAAALALGALVGAFRGESPPPAPDRGPVFGLLPDDPSLLRDLPRTKRPQPPPRPDDVRPA